MRAIERYRDFIDSASDGIVVLDGAGRGALHEPRRRGGHRATRATGWPESRSCRSCPSRSAPRWSGRSAAPIAAEPVDNFDLELVTTSGDRIIVSVASIGILSEHEAAIFSFRDVTLARELERELRRTSEFLERILNSTVDGIIAANMRGTILLFNQGAERICGYKASDVIGQHVGAQAVPAGRRRARSCA